MRWGKGGYEEGGEKAHIASKADEINFVFVEYGGDLAVVDFAFEAFGGDGARGNVAGGGAFEAGGAGLVANYDGDFSVRDAGRRRHYRRGLRSWNRDRLGERRCAWS